MPAPDPPASAGRDPAPPAPPAAPGTEAQARMFDQVSPRYDLLNRVMSLGRDAAWRRAMWAEVPEGARVVLDLCTGSGSSLGGLRRPGRLVLGMDVSLRMLEVAFATHGEEGWAPRLACADAFRLPLRDGTLEAVTIAFGARNLRPRRSALAEIARALAPGGTLVVLEALAPRPGVLAPLHRFYVRHGIPLAGRLSPDPSAYRYLSRSIFEFGDGGEFEADLAAAGFEVIRRRTFLLGATGLWTAARRGGAGGAPGLQAARLGEVPRGEMRTREPASAAEWRWWTGAQLAIALALLASLLYALNLFTKLADDMPLEPWQRVGMKILLGLSAVASLVRGLVLWLRLKGPPPRS